MNYISVITEGIKNVYSGAMRYVTTTKILITMRPSGSPSLKKPFSKILVVQIVALLGIKHFPKQS